jgi:hypothetical protein
VTALALGRSTSSCESLVVSGLKQIAPIFPVVDLEAALVHYRRLGFVTRRYEGGGYAYARRDGIEIHLGTDGNRDQRSSAAYLWVEDADELADEWRSAGVEVHPPVNTDWGQCEGAVVDPDGNVIRFGSSIPDE